MTDIIRLLPDSVANQIAAGEVVQRPASAVKELLENSIDAGAKEITLNIKDAGRTLIQVIDNGAGMSPADARLCFERHATSKISAASDLFRILTLGFRGEALASIAAIAQVELKSRRDADDLGTQILIEGSVVKSQNAVQCNQGTSISVKNLYFNTPARRNFLKSDPVEIRHIMEEFQRVAMVYPHIAFRMIQNGKTVFQLNPGSLKQRLVQVFGTSLNQKLVTVEESTNIVRINGFIGKPEYARKVRGEQYFFINGRFVRLPFMHHAVESAFTELIQDDSHPIYFLYLDIEPSNIDINIHPTKTEVKLLDEKHIYSILKAAVRRAIGRHNLTPAIDFDLDPIFNVPEPSPGQTINPPVIKVDQDYNPFNTSTIRPPETRFRIKPNTEGWEKYLELPEADPSPSDTQMEIPQHTESNSDSVSDKHILCIMGAFVVTSVRSGLMLIDIKSAIERIHFERFLKNISLGNGTSQQELFPDQIHLSPQNALIVKELLPELKALGYMMEALGELSYVVHGTPSGLENQDIPAQIEALLENYKNLGEMHGNNKNAALALAAAKNSANTLNPRQDEELKALIDLLFACEMPHQSPSGINIIKILNTEEIKELLR